MEIKVVKTAHQGGHLPRFGYDGLFKRTPSAAAVLVDEFDASLPRQPNWVRFVNSHLTGL
jgi:hypothetical protein